MRVFPSNPRPPKSGVVNKVKANCRRDFSPYLFKQVGGRRVLKLGTLRGRVCRGHVAHSGNPG